MGTDIYPILRMEGATPEQELDIISSIETEFGHTFTVLDPEDDPVRYQADEIRWSNLTEDMQKFSERFPEVLFRIWYEWPDGSYGDEWIEWFKNGKTYSDVRPDWEPPGFDEERLK